MIGLPATAPRDHHDREQHRLTSRPGRSPYAVRMPSIDVERALRMRSRGQAIGGGVRLGSVSEIMGQVFALQSQDPSAAALGMRARGRGLTMRQVRRAAEERDIVRGWLMRGTLHTVPGADYRWLVGLLGPVVLKASARRLRELGLDDVLCDRAEDALAELLAAQRVATRAELTARLAELGIDTRGQAAFHLIRRAALRGRICCGPYRGGEPAFVLLDDWLPPAADPGPSGEDAVRELARRYLRACAPSTVDDFAAWSGLPLPAVRRGWKDLAAAGETVPCQVLDQQCAVPADRADECGLPTGDGPDVRLLPMYDGYLVGYRNRALSVPAAHELQVRPGGGQIRATVAADGLILGTWLRHAGHGVEVSLFTPGSASQDALAAEMAEVACFTASG